MKLSAFGQDVQHILKISLHNFTKLSRFYVILSYKYLLFNKKVYYVIENCFKKLYNCVRGDIMTKKYDLVIVGGGFAGVAAAIEAARGGLKAIIVEKYNCLGGAAMNCLVMPFMHYDTNLNGERIKLAGGIFNEITDRVCGPTSGESLYFDEEIMKLELNRMCIENGVDLLFNTTVTEAKTENGVISSVVGWGKSARVELFADNFVDATGDAELSVLAGCETRLGREKDNLCQPMTLCFRMNGVDKELFFKTRNEINPLYIEYQKQGKIKNPREDVLIFNTLQDNVLHFNTTRVVKLNPTDPFDVTRAEIEAREQVFEVYEFLKENFEAFKNAKVLSTALQIGIRESRKVVGEYTLTKEDLLSLARFEDGVVTANYDIDIHSPDGTGTSHHYFAPGEWYEIPYRCLIPRDAKNLLVAGRCISATHEAQASLRIMPYCSALGQVAGAAIAQAVRSGKTLRTIDVAALREQLRNEGFIL